jgi:hypothetical protein
MSPGFNLDTSGWNADRKIRFVSNRGMNLLPFIRASKCTAGTTIIRSAPNPHESSLLGHTTTLEGSKRIMFETLREMATPENAENGSFSGSK